jgi:hypothetical protein
MGFYRLGLSRPLEAIWNGQTDLNKKDAWKEHGFWPVSCMLSAFAVNTYLNFSGYCPNSSAQISENGLSGHK